MKKEKVIIFEGEHNFVTPKNTVYDKKTGMTHVIPEYANLVQPPNETVAPANCFQIDPVTGVQVPTDCSGLGGGTPVAPVGGGTADITTTTTLPPADTTTPTTTTTLPAINIPINLGTAPTSIGTLVSGGGARGGGGGSAESGAAKKKTFLQKYWWLLLLVAAGGGYWYYKKGKK